MRLHNPFHSFNRLDFGIWLTSLAAVTCSFFLLEERSPLSLIGSMVGVTALIFVAKGDVWGQVLTILFSVLYSLVSLRFRYYGEIITYLGMTAPIAMMSVVSWLRHPFEKGRPEVRVDKLSGRKFVVMVVTGVAVTAVFHCILKALGTPNLVWSTVSITTSYLASFLMLFRSEMYALAYAANDMVLIVLWVTATLSDASNLPMAICFSMFLCNDIYGFICWRKMRIRQRIEKTTA